MVQGAATTLATEETEAAVALARLAETAAQQRLGDLAYGGEISPGDAWRFLCAFPGSVLVDVRTRPEWEFTGVPNCSGAAGRLLTVSWKNYPDYMLNDRFAQTLELEGVLRETPLFFMCRSGGRSLDAAVAMTALGYRYCFNVTGGFEGKSDSNGHRGHVEGWKTSGLPWVQG